MNIRSNPVRITALAAAATTVLALSACGGDDSAGSAADGAGETVKVAVFPSFNALGPRTAEIEGVFEEHGIDVELITVATPGEATPQLLGGKIDFALMDMVSPITAATEGVPLVMVAPGAVGTEPGEDGFGVGNFWVKEGSDVASVKDIENASFGIPQTKGQLWIDVREAVDEAGGDSSKIEFVEVPNTLAALKSGSVDVVTTAEPSGTAALSETGIEPLSAFVNAGGDLAYSYVTTREYAENNAEAVENFEAAILEANQMVNDQDGLAAEVAATYVEAPAELLEKARYATFQEEPISEENVQVAIDRMVRYGLLAEGDAPDPGTMLVGE